MSDAALPVTRYALSGDVNIAYQVMGKGPVDLIMVPGYVSHVEFAHEFPGYTASLRRLSAFARVITFDKRGQGLSDRVPGAPTLEERMDDVRAVMDAVESKRAVLFGVSEGCAMSVLFAATYPDRVAQLVLFGGFARSARADNPELSNALLEKAVQAWGTGAVSMASLPSLAGNMDVVAQVAKFERLSASPGAMRALTVMNALIDVRSILPSVRVPTLVLHRKDDVTVPVEKGRELAVNIPGATCIEYAGYDHVLIYDTDALISDVQEFITGSCESFTDDLQRVLATVLFTDIVDSTRSAATIGDHAWRQLLDSYDQLGIRIVAKYRGTLVKTTGDGILAMFDGPGRAIRCALEFGAAAKQIGLPTRAGLHTGEIELRGRDIGGIAVHAAARVMAQSQPGEVLVSRVVTDLVAGAGLRFSDRGAYELKGLPGRWDLFAVAA